MQYLFGNKKNLGGKCAYIVGLFVISFAIFSLYDVKLTLAQGVVPEEVGNAIFGIFYSFVITVFGFLFVQAAWLFDIGLNSFLLGFGELYYKHGVGFSVEMTWGIIRDLFNLSLIFGIIYIGFKMILDSNDSHGQKMLVNLIAAALLVNFSLFIIKFLIDLSNITTLVIAHGFTDAKGNIVPSISNAFINMLQLGTLFKIDQSGIVAMTAGGGFAYIVGIMIFLATAAFVFAAGGILLMIRFIVLNIYLVFSPIMFIGWVFPAFEHHSKKYMEGFLGQAFFAPAYLLMLYLSFQVLSRYAVISVPAGGTAATGFGAAFTGTGEFQAIIPFFVMAMIFLVASLVVAKNMGAVGAATAIKIGTDWRKKVGGAITGAGGYMAYKRIDKMANSENGLARGLGRSLTFVGARDKAEKSYKSSIQGQMAETRKKRTGEMATRKGDADAKKLIKDSADTPGADLENAVRNASTDQITAVLRDNSTTVNQYNNIVDSLTHEQRKKILDSTDDKVSASEKAKIGARASNKINDDIAAGRNEISKLTPKQVDVMGRKWIKDNFDSLTNSQIEKLASDSTVLGESEKSTLKKDWGDEIKNIYTTNPAGFDFAKYMHNKTAKDVAALPAEVLIDIGANSYLTDKVLREIAMSNMTTTDRNTIRMNMIHPGGPGGPGAGYFSPTNNHFKNNW